jgi:hypothetical protein
MKEEITVELRELRANIEKDRDEDRLELRILQRKHTELKDDLAKTKGDKEQLKTELTFVTETVKVLKAQIDLKQAEYDQVFNASFCLLKFILVFLNIAYFDSTKKLCISL